MTGSQQTRRPDWYVVAWLFFVVLIAARLVVAWKLPLDGNEAYYWGWSRHLAFGYIDHPPAVAWLIAAFGWLGRDPGFVRLGFVLCAAVGGLALNDCASRLARDRVAGIVAALAFALAPLAIGPVSPNGPYMAFWALGLAATVRMMEAPTVGRALWLGFVLGGVLLSRMTGFALLAGLVGYSLAPARRAVWSLKFALVPLVVLVTYAPFLVWNAKHDWASFAFAFHRAAGALSPSLHLAVSTLLGQLGTLSPGLWLGAVVALFMVRSSIVTWTAVPLAATLTVLSFFSDIQAHWMLGPYVSLCVGMGLGFVKLRPASRLAWMAAAALPAAAIFGLLILAAGMPERGATLYESIADGHAPVNGPFSLYGYPLLTADVRRILVARNAVAVTDEYDLAAELSYYADVPAVVIGTDQFGRETRTWTALDENAQQALIVSRTALNESEAYRSRLALACSHVSAGPSLRYWFRGAPAGAYFTTWCEGPRPNAVRILRWESNN